MLESLKTNLTFFANIFAFSFILVLIANFAYAPSPVSWNFLWDIFYTRSGGPFLYANHVSVELAVCAVSLFFMLKNPKAAWKWLILIFSTASLHELILTVVSFQTYVSEYGYLIYQPATYRWFIWLSFTLAAALSIGNAKQRKKIWEIAAITLVVESVWVALIYVVGFEPRSIIEYQPGPGFFDPWENFFEVFSWIVPLSWWFASDHPIEWLQWNVLIKEMQPHNYLRYLLFYRHRQTPIELNPCAKMLYFKEGRGWLSDYVPRGGLKGKTVLDVGAGCGETALLFFEQGAEKVICIEPDAKKLAMLRRNASKMRWNVEVVPHKFELQDMTRPFDFAKVDCEGCEVALFDMARLPPLVVEIHTRETVAAFAQTFPELKFTKKNHWPFNTWIGRIDA